MIVLGVDPGTRHTGLGTVRVEGSRERLLGASTIHMSGDLDHTLRLQKIYQGVLDAIDEYTPDELAVELPFMGKNAQAMLKLGRAQAAVMLAAMHREVPVAQYAPAEIKKAVVGNGRATKDQVTYMVRQRLALTEEYSEDAHDALGIALCHAARRHTAADRPGRTEASGAKTASGAVAKPDACVRGPTLSTRTRTVCAEPSVEPLAAHAHRSPRSPEAARAVRRRARRHPRIQTGMLRTASQNAIHAPRRHQSTSAACVAVSPEASVVTAARMPAIASVAQNHSTPATAIVLA